jgi:putative iron-only hydrogenase system regulator
MEKRIGTSLMLIQEKDSVDLLNTTLSRHSSIIISRQGLPLKDRGVNLISIIFEGTTDEIGSLTGQIGRIKGVSVKSVLLKQ